MSHDLLSDDLWRCIGLKLGVADCIRFRAVSKLWASLIPLSPWLMLAEEGQKSISDEDEEVEDEEVEDEDEEVEDEDEDDHEYEYKYEYKYKYKYKYEYEYKYKYKYEYKYKDDQQDHLSPPPPRRGFVSLKDQQIYHIDVPQLHQAQCVGSTGNWLITAHIDETIRLLNPFSTQQFYLPPLSAFAYQVYHISCWAFNLLRKVILSSSPVNGRDCIAMAIHNNLQVLALARLGDDKWITVGNVATGIIEGIEDVIFYKGHFYASVGNGMLFKCDIGDDLTPPTASCLSQGFRNKSFWEVSYLVEWLGELLLVIKFIDDLDSDVTCKATRFGGVTYKTSKFEVYKFDIINKKWNLLKSLGEHSLFLGFNTSISVRASNFFGSVKKNCIYFTHDFFGAYKRGDNVHGHDMGVFNLEGNSITPLSTGVSPCFYSPHVWIVPESIPGPKLVEKHSPGANSAIFPKSAPAVAVSNKEKVEEKEESDMQVCSIN